MTDMAIIKGSQKIIEDVFRGFRDELMENYGSISFKSKSDASPVTELDIKIENALKEQLLTQYPELGFKGEETDFVNESGEAVWYIDPIDGTSSFIHGLPYCSNMAALVIDGQVVASIIYRFVQDQMYTAIKGEGAYRNAEKLSIIERPLNDSFIYSDSLSYKTLYSHFAPHKLKFFAPVGATGHFLASIADGTIQGACYFGANIQPHDVAPGMLLVYEAGGDGVSLENKSLGYESRQFILGTKAVCELTRELKKDILTEDH